MIFSLNKPHIAFENLINRFHSPSIKASVQYLCQGFDHNWPYGEVVLYDVINTTIFVISSGSIEQDLNVCSFIQMANSYSRIFLVSNFLAQDLTQCYFSFIGENRRPFHLRSFPQVIQTINFAASIAKLNTIEAKDLLNLLLSFIQHLGFFDYTSVRKNKRLYTSTAIASNDTQKIQLSDSWVLFAFKGLYPIIRNSSPFIGLMLENVYDGSKFIMDSNLHQFDEQVLSLASIADMWDFYRVIPGKLQQY